MKTNISEKDLLKLARNIAKRKNKMFPNDPLDIAVGRVVFVKWMKQRGLWAKYKEHIITEEGSYEQAWLNPHSIVGFLGRCSFNYNKAYVPWRDYCVISLIPMIKRILCN